MNRDSSGTQVVLDRSAAREVQRQEVEISVGYDPDEVVLLAPLFQRLDQRAELPLLSVEAS